MVGTVGKRMHFNTGYDARWQAAVVSDWRTQSRIMGPCFGVRKSCGAVGEKIVHEERSLFVQARSFCYIAEIYKEIP